MTEEQAAIEDLYALTPLQQGMLFHSVSSEAPGLYLVQSCWTLKGDLDVDRLAAAWRTVMKRHRALCTALEWQDLEKPVQVVYRASIVDLPLIQRDLRQEADQDRAFEQIFAEDRTRGFSLSDPPLWRVTLVRVCDDTWHLLWSYHQTIIDGWSAGLIQSEVRAAYEEEPLLPAAPYKRYIAWLQQQDASADERYWRHRLQGFRTPVTLMPKKERRTTLAASARENCFTFRKSFTETLTASLRQERLTMSSLMHAAWSLVLSQRSAATDVAYGAVVAGRPPDLDGVDTMVGFFINTIPMRARVPTDGRTTFAAWIDQLQGDFLTAREQEHCALVDIQGWSEVPRGQALFETILVFENYPVADPEAGWGKDLQVLDFRAQENLSYPIAMYAGIVEGRLMLKALYDGAHFEPSTIEWVIEELKTIIEHAADHLHQPVRRLLPEGEERRLTTEWNDTAAAFPVTIRFAELFEQQVLRTPDKRAVVCGAASLTYRALNERANGAARMLMERGVGPNQLVGILADRNIDFLVAILGTLKAGGAYLPLDPRAPVARQTTVWEQASLSLVLFGPAYETICVPGIERIPIAQATRAKPVAQNPAPKTHPSDLAYVIFTSGSTGLPKGAMVEQRGMVNHLHAKIRDLAITESDRIAQNASQCFDISVWQFLAALLVGGETHIFGDDIALDTRALLSHVEEDGVTILETVPSLLRVLLDGGADPSLTRLRWLVPTGEALPPDLATWWLSRFPHVPMLNAYGPTECSDDVTHYALHEPAEVTRIPIGRPLANMRMYILDERLQLVPIGVPGELYIGGVGVGRGYINDPRKTAETFVPDPFSEQPGARLYRTGDLVQYLPEVEGARSLCGQLDFLGRLDHQVKIRGFRIELGDIEAALSAHDSVNQCVVVARRIKEVELALVAHFTCFGKAPTTSALREHLSERLPDYMVPSVFMAMEKMPLNKNGKLDRKALPIPGEGERISTGREYVPPRGPQEERIAAIWCEVLGLSRVGRNDTFFDLGGHSLLILKVYERLRQENDDLTIVDLFQHATIPALARFLTGDTADPEPSGHQPRVRREALRRQRDRRKKART